MAYEELKSSGITADTPKNIMLGAGTIHKGFKLEGGQWNFEESLIGATSGGSKLEIKPEFTDIEVDGALVKTKGLTVKTGETATMEVNFVEMTPELLKMCVIGDETTSTEYTGYKEIKSRARIQTSDYVEKLAYVGKKTDGTPIIIIFDFAICTSGLSVEGKNKEAGTFTGTFECVADTTPECDTLPWHILYPTPSTIEG
ncbi:MAG: hypothetical protein HUJ98_01000 [Bacteroidaceae bacterium]|nr:hypothetical protein [Holdemanella sp.]MCF0185050.1 hypothetical protein [Bacteroidaceae bacterium]